MNSAEPQYRILSAAPSLSRSGLLQALAAHPRYHLFHTDDAREALQLAAGPLDLILVDGDNGWVSLPDLVIRAKGADADVPILVFGNGSPAPTDERLWTIGIDDCLRHPILPAELLHHVARALKGRRLGRRCDELTRENQELYQLAITDGLTKLVNRRHFVERLNSEFARARRFGGRVGCVISDIDHFKKVNDTYGHLVGDRVLRELAGLISHTVRRIDTAGRYGGEEFVVLLPETVIEGVVYVAEKLRRAIEEHDFTPADPGEAPGPQHITISLGAAGYPEAKVESAENLLELADHALYRAKQSGRNRVETS